MCYYDKKTFQHEGFSLEAYPILIKPEDADFNASDPYLAIQCGADFHVSYQGKFSSNPQLGLLQFVRSETIVGNPPRDPESGVCIDHELENSHQLVDYLYGRPGEKITYQASKFYDKPTTIRGTNQCDIYDIPRELHGFTGQNLNGSPILIKFWEFAVEISGGYGIIYPNGIKWSLSFGQVPGKNEYTCSVAFGGAKFSDLNYKMIFGNQGAVNENTYKIAASK